MENNLVKLAFKEEGAGKPIILLHGFCGSKDYWEKVIPYLRKFYRVIAVDVRGHGETDTTKIGYDIHDMAEDLYNFFIEHDLKDAYLFGHSMGGYITLDFVDHHPDLISGYGLIHSTALPDSPEAKKKRSAGVSTVEEQGVSFFVKDLIPKLLSKETRENEQEMLKTLYDIGVETRPTGIIGALKAMKNREDKNYVLQRNDIPALLVAGARDEVVPIEKVFTVSGEHITQIVIDKAGHMGIFETPEQVSTAITSFIEKVNQ
ncbi:alpha/beta hydrolase [Pradoshia sp. D12]|uniref:alpha/beta fold hydrolase n=1 Tax=Bacillaceae TaxID=186817 RepID=UPI00080AF172|nr:MULTISPECIES: alpha/beta hydrolase [Bacillaceae]OCA83527.1 hypothetical protein A8L44_11905 [Bacillus sp. FJAT-27986]QFK71769.1 alpha/beta hydrolase [Pradoshia sp. D12]TPF73564.1 alpha/beta hydrolase [Bacillus sp. D12]